MPECQDVPSPIDFTDITQAREWVAHTMARRPWRPQFFETFATALNEHFDEPIRVAELGSGPGHLANIVLRSCSVETYTALDFSPAMHQLATEHLGDQSERVRFMIADFREPGWTQSLGKIDALITMQAAHEVRHKSRVPELLTRAWTVIRPGGLLLFCDHYTENAELFFYTGRAEKFPYRGRVQSYLTPPRRRRHGALCCGSALATLSPYPSSCWRSAHIPHPWMIFQNSPFLGQNRSFEILADCVKTPLLLSVLRPCL